MKKRRMKKLNNKGYSLIELIIVMAIIVIFSAAAMVTITIMQSAKVREASVSFDSEISELISNSKSKACDANLDKTIDDSDEGFSFGIRLHRNGGKCYIQNVLVKNGGYVYDDAYEKANNPNDGKGLSLSPYVDIKYTDLAGNTITIGDQANETVVVHYKKNGTCDMGYGTYNFIRSSTGSSVATVTLNKNGSHQSK